MIIFRVPLVFVSSQKRKSEFFWFKEIVGNFPQMRKILEKIIRVQVSLTGESFDYQYGPIKNVKIP